MTITKTDSPKALGPLDKLVFGKEFTSHMLEIDWDSKNGWHAPSIHPYRDLTLSPAAMCLHYSLQLFEGMKAYKDSQGDIRLFRPDKNMVRMNRSAHRLALPTFSGEDFIDCLKELLRVDEHFIPQERGYSLYLRPTLIGTQGSLGVAPSNFAKLFVICSPVGPYYPEGWKPVKLYADSQNVRAWPGGTGNAKIGGNYAPGIMPALEAQKKGYSQILWIFGPDHQITEVGTMNMFTFWINEQGERELITAPLTDGTILPGVTRDSILDLSRQWGEFKVTERSYTMGELLKALSENRVLECFGAGTAAVVSPIQVIGYEGKDYTIPLDEKEQIGPLTKRFANSIMGIQYGEIEHEWSVKV